MKKSLVQHLYVQTIHSYLVHSSSLLRWQNSLHTMSTTASQLNYSWHDAEKCFTHCPTCRHSSQLWKIWFYQRSAPQCWTIWQFEYSTFAPDCPCLIAGALSVWVCHQLEEELCCRWKWCYLPCHWCFYNCCHHFCCHHFCCWSHDVK